MVARNPPRPKAAALALSLPHPGSARDPDSENLGQALPPFRRLASRGSKNSEPRPKAHDDAVGEALRKPSSLARIACSVAPSAACRNWDSGPGLLVVRYRAGLA